MKFTLAAAVTAAMVWMAVSMEAAAHITRISAPKHVQLGHKFNVTVHTEKSDKNILNHYAVAAYGDRSRGKKVVGDGNFVQLDLAGHEESNTGDGSFKVQMRAPKKAPKHKQSVHLSVLTTSGANYNSKLETFSANVTFIDHKKPKVVKAEPTPKKKVTSKN